MNRWVINGKDERPIWGLILGEDIGGKDSKHLDGYSQVAISMDLLFSNTEVSDDEFAEIGETLGGWETEFKQNLLNGFFQTYPVN